PIDFSSLISRPISRGFSSGVRILAKTTRVWETTSGQLVTSIPKSVRIFLTVTQSDQVSWEAHDRVAIMTRAREGLTAYGVSLQGKGSTLTTLVPAFVRDELGLRVKGEVEWAMKTRGDERFAEVRRA
ncbi:MAG: hypothetical protein ACYDCK_10550, partial [Thermoplasmatota archaeon]